MITWNFIKQEGVLCVPLLERLERGFVEQIFLRDVVIIQVNEAYKGCLQGS